MFRKLLVVGSGDVCRSVMGAALLRQRLPAAQGFVVESAGIGARADAPADPLAATLMQERGIALEEHRARPLTLELGREFDLILVMERGQKIWIERRIPELRGRVYTLGHWSDLVVPDPHGKSRDELLRIMERIDQAVADWAERLV